MGTNKNLKIALSLQATVFIIFSLSCQGKRHSTGIGIEVTHISFECQSPAVTDSMIRLKPIIMYMEISVTNNMNDLASFGTYNHKFDPGNKKYGVFKLINNSDTIELYSRYDNDYPIEPGQTIDLQLEYEGERLFGPDKLLDALSIGWDLGDSLVVDKPRSATMIKKVQQIFDDFKLIYMPYVPGNELTYTTSFSPNLTVDYVYDDFKKWLTMSKDSIGWRSTCN